MKKLQNNFTTPEQSKRLLELGVPEWTADCFYKLDLYSFKTEMCFTKEDSLLHHYTPCWSVGRLIEIIKICSDLDSILGYQIAYNTKHKTSLLHIVIQVIEDYINDLNFSKLEEYEKNRK